MNKPLCFVTGNQHKVDEFRAIMEPHQIEYICQPFDVPEIQGTPEEVARAKCLAAASLYDGPVVTEDVSFCIEAWNGLPGAYIKQFLQSVGPSGIVDMLTPTPNKNAYAQCIYSYCAGKDQSVQQFVGQCQGVITKNTGKSHFGNVSFDGIFAPNGHSGMTFGDMAIETKNQISHRALAVNKLVQFLVSLKK